MGLLDAIGRLISKIFQKIFDFLGDIFGELFWIILIIVLIYFAPVIAAYLASVGAPAFIVSAFEVLALATPYVTTAVTWLWEGGASLVSSAWSAYSGLSMGQQATIALGAAALLAPEETAEVIEEGTKLVGDVLGQVVGGLAKTPLGLVVMGLAAYWLFFKDDNGGDRRYLPSEA